MTEYKEQENKEVAESLVESQDVPSEEESQDDLSEEESEEAPKVEPVDAQYRVEISDDHLRAYVSVLGPEHEGQDVTLPELLNAVKEAGVVFGLKEQELQRIAYGRVYDRKLLIAEGFSADNGKDGEIVNRYALGSQGIPKHNSDGTVEFKELGLIHNVTKGQVLCDIIPPTEGTKGMTVLGQEIPPIPGKDARPSIGKNVFVNDTNTEIYAGITGNLYERNKIMEIDDTFTVSGDVDNSVGNIDFVGNVVVKGDVKSGFSITSGGVVRVNGIVEAATIKAEKDVTIAGMNGQGGGLIQCGGTLNANFIENATLQVKGSIYSNSIMYCNVKCGGTLEMKGKNGCIVGGTYVVASDVIARTVGSPSHARTDFTLGSSTTLVEEMALISERLNKIDSDCHKLKQAIEYLNSKDKSTLSKDKLKVLDQAAYNRSVLMMEREKLLKTYYNMEQELASPNSCKIICKGTIYTGTRIAMGNLSVQVTMDRDNVMVYATESEIVFGAA